MLGLRAHHAMTRPIVPVVAQELGVTSVPRASLGQCGGGVAVLDYFGGGLYRSSMSQFRLLQDGKSRSASIIGCTRTGHKPK